MVSMPGLSLSAGRYVVQLAAPTTRLLGLDSGTFGSSVPEAGLEPARPCRKEILRLAGNGGGSKISQFVALSRFRGLRGGSYSPRVMDTQMDTCSLLRAALQEISQLPHS